MLSMPHRSPELGLSMSGGARVSALPMTLPILRSDDWNCGILRRIFLGELGDFLRGFFRVVVENEARPSGESETTPTSVVIMFSPCFSSCMSRTMSGRSGPAECASVEQRKPG